MKQAIITDKVPAAIGPYSLGIQAGKMVFLSGQLPIDSATNQLIEDDIQVQTRQILNNIQAILNAAGGSLANVVKTTIFLKDMDDSVSYTHLPKPATKLAQCGLYVVFPYGR